MTTGEYAILKHLAVGLAPLGFDITINHGLAVVPKVALLVISEQNLEVLPKMILGDEQYTIIAIADPDLISKVALELQNIVRRLRYSITPDDSTEASWL